MTVPLAPSTPAALSLDPQPLDRLGEIITGHLAEGRYPGAQIAVARRGQLALYRAALRKHPRRLRFWSAACSTGEEPYSMAIEILEKRPVLAGWNLKVLGTDISGAALAEARAGLYDARAVRLVEPARRLAFFNEDSEAGRWTVKADVKVLVTWKLHNLLSPLASEPSAQAR